MKYSETEQETSQILLFKFQHPRTQTMIGPRSFAVVAASLLRDGLCGTVFLLLYGDQRCCCVLFSNN